MPYVAIASQILTGVVTSPVVVNACGNLVNWYQTKSAIDYQKKKDLDCAGKIAENSQKGTTKGLIGGWVDTAKDYFDVFAFKKFDENLHRQKMFQPEGSQQKDSLLSLSNFLRQTQLEMNEVTTEHSSKQLKSTIFWRTAGVAVACLSIAVGFTAMLAQGGLLPFYLGMIVGLIGLGLLLYCFLTLCKAKLAMNHIKLNQVLKQLDSHNLLSDKSCKLNEDMLKIYQEGTKITKNQRQLCKNMHLTSLSIFASCLIGLSGQALPILIPSMTALFVGFDLMLTGSHNRQEIEAIWHALLRHQERHNEEVPAPVVPPLTWRNRCLTLLSSNLANKSSQTGEPPPPEGRQVAAKSNLSEWLLSPLIGPTQYLLSHKSCKSLLDFWEKPFEIDLDIPNIG